MEEEEEGEGEEEPVEVLLDTTLKTNCSSSNKNTNNNRLAGLPRRYSRCRTTSRVVRPHGRACTTTYHSRTWELKEGWAGVEVTRATRQGSKTAALKALKAHLQLTHQLDQKTLESLEPTIGVAAEVRELTEGSIHMLGINKPVRGCQLRLRIAYAVAAFYSFSSFYTFGYSRD